MVQFKVSSIYGEPRASVAFSRAMVPIVQGLFQILLWSFLATSRHQSMYLFFFNSWPKLSCSCATYLLFVIFRPSLWCMITVLSWNWLEDLFFTHHSYVSKAVIDCCCFSLFFYRGILWAYRQQTGDGMPLCSYLNAQFSFRAYSFIFK